MNIILGRESYDDDTAVGSTGEFVALQSFSGSESGDDESTVQRSDTQGRKKRSETKRTMLPIGMPRDDDIEAAQSTDSAVYNDGSCGACFSEMLGWDPANVVVKVSVSECQQ